MVLNKYVVALIIQVQFFYELPPNEMSFLKQGECSCFPYLQVRSAYLTFRLIDMVWEFIISLNYK